MKSKIRRIRLEKLMPHPDNPNRMSRANFAKLVRNIKRTGQYEPLVVRPHPNLTGFFQIINGQHRCRALKALGHERVDAVVWSASDEDTDILLTTLNRLGSRDILDKKLTLLRRLDARMPTRDLAKLVPQTRGQLERLIHHKPLSQAMVRRADAFAMPVVFFVDKTQQEAIETALSLVGPTTNVITRSARRAAALTDIAKRFLDTLQEH